MGSRFSFSAVSLHSRILLSPSITTKSASTVTLVSVHMTRAVNVPKVGSGLVFPYANTTLASFRFLHRIIWVVSHSHAGLSSMLLFAPEWIRTFGKWTPQRAWLLLDYCVVYHLLQKTHTQDQCWVFHPVLHFRFHRHQYLHDLCSSYCRYQLSLAHLSYHGYWYLIFPTAENFRMSLSDTSL